MNFFLFHIIIVAFCLLPTTAFGADGKCIESDCVNGKGIYLYWKGEKYDGEFKNGVINGDGTYTYLDGSKYIGEFANGVRHGQGTLKIVDGITYVGQWANDLPNGQGVKTLADGMQYSGEFKNGLMYGSGTLVMQDGSMIKIKWNNAKPLQEDWHMTVTPGNTQKLFSQEHQQSAKHIEGSSQELTTSEGTPSQKFDQSAVSPEQVSPQTANVDIVSVNDMVHTEEISKSQLWEKKKIKFETATPIGKQDGSETKEVFTQNTETTSRVEYASIAVEANIRSDASLTSEVLRTVPPGYPVAVLEQQTDWLLVEDFRERKGWVYASLVIEPGTVIIKVSKGNLRSGPSLKDDIIVQLDYGTIMSVLDKNGEWLKVSDLEELTGWMHLQVIWPSAEMNK